MNANVVKQRPSMNNTYNSFDNTNTNLNRSSDTNYKTNGMNDYFMNTSSSISNSQNYQHDFCNTRQQNQVGHNYQSHVTYVLESNGNLDRPVTVRDILKLFQPIEVKTENIEKTFNTRISVLENKVNCFEADNIKKGAKIDTLTEIIINLTKSVNHDDGKKRTSNILIKRIK